jgi:hypothetical protein
MSDIVYGPGNPGEIIDNTLPEFDNWHDNFNGDIHVSGDPSTGVYSKPNFSTSEKLEITRDHMITAYKTEGLSRIQATMPAIDNIAMVELLAALWPTIDQTKAGADLILVKDIYQFAKSRIATIKTADQATIDAADPVTDSWPT